LQLSMIRIISWFLFSIPLKPKSQQIDPLNLLLRVGPPSRLFSFLVRRVLATKPAIFVEFEFIRRGTLVFGCRIISAFAFRACKGNNNSHLKDSLAFIR